MEKAEKLHFLLVCHEIKENNKNFVNYDGYLQNYGFKLQ